ITEEHINRDVNQVKRNVQSSCLACNIGHSHVGGAHIWPHRATEFSREHNHFHKSTLCNIARSKPSILILGLDYDFTMPKYTEYQLEQAID
ncbi:hypothetical protein BGZ61DRAFT_577645, partial [Ilyonectria robusta]|uniref:uncharacterized protein n=1 Tax=Ilyonectria robusta TaxID=1079257 RepID=UPI001E8E8C8A